MDLGYISPIRFPEIPIRGRTKDAGPDFATFNGSVLLLPEIKSGNNLNPSHIDQMERFNAVTIEDGQQFLKDSDRFSDQGLEHNDLSAVETCIVYIKDRYDDRIDQEYNEEKLSDLVNYGPILSQSRGGLLQIERGEFGNTELNSFLSKGVPLPNTPSTAIFLNEEIEKESLAVSICYDLVIPDLKHGDVRISVGEITDKYPSRAIDVGDVLKVMEFLERIGACSQINDERWGREYVFEQSDQRDIFNVKSVVSEERVDKYLDSDDEDSDGQQEFGDI